MRLSCRWMMLTLLPVLPRRSGVPGYELGMARMSLVVTSSKLLP